MTSGSADDDTTDDGDYDRGDNGNRDHAGDVERGNCSVRNASNGGLPFSREVEVGAGCHCGETTGDDSSHDEDDDNSDNRDNGGDDAGISRVVFECFK